MHEIMLHEQGYSTRLKIDQVDAILFAEQRMINIVIMVEQHC
jgi:RAB protein geranylgeranyltransferase component A